jgi:hypothetical protein
MAATPVEPESSWPPTDGTCPVPDLCDLPFLSAFYAFSTMLARGGPEGRKAYSLSMNFVRIVDKMVIDYGHARAAMVAYANGPNAAAIGRLVLAIGYFENVVTDLLRALEFADRIRQDRASPQLAPKHASVFSSGVYGRVNDMRNAIEHGYGEILKGLNAMAPNCLVPKKDGLDIGVSKIGYTELASWIRQLYDMASKHAHFQKPAEEA